MAKREKKIQDYDFIYAFLRYYVDLALRLSYRHINYVGMDRIPKDGAVIYAPNHTNALMDALVILAMDTKAKVFVARADIFKKPVLAKIFKWLKIMPIMRMRDGAEEVRKNNETIEKAVDVLRDKVPFCIFPEGQHQTKYSAQPLAKGIFRIAFQAQELMPDMPLYIVPVGMRYGNFFRFRSTLRVQIGEPINVQEFLAAHADMTVPEQMNAIREVLDAHLKEAIFYIPNDEHYEGTHEVCAAVVKRRVKDLRRSDKKWRKAKRMDLFFEANNATVAQITRLREEKPDVAEKLLKLGEEASKMRKSDNISLVSVAVRNFTLSQVMKYLLLLVSLPYSIPASIFALPLTGVLAKLCSLFKDGAFHNSVRYLVSILLWPLLMAIYAIVAYALLPWQWALPLTLALLPAPIVAQEVYRLIRLIISDMRLHRNKPLRKKYQEIREILFSNK
ncbi:MAG: 1-acyl-sn-glycerol-3-phosphate acyltransferase [Alistipes sp.]|nr:1-acyl-sn-glycerol-3-phosphate acyltransferase [Alistipes sp.]